MAKTKKIFFLALIIFLSLSFFAFSKSALADCDNPECDPDTYGPQDCSDYDPGYDGGTTSCNSDCTLNTDNCTWCGDGNINNSEQCDDPDYGNYNDCTYYTDSNDNYFTGGSLGCDNNCQLDFGGCTGNGQGISGCNVQTDACTDTNSTSGYCVYDSSLGWACATSFDPYCDQNVTGDPCTTPEGNGTCTVDAGTSRLYCNASGGGGSGGTTCANQEGTCTYDSQCPPGCSLGTFDCDYNSGVTCCADPAATGCASTVPSSITACDSLREYDPCDNNQGICYFAGNVLECITSGDGVCVLNTNNIGDSCGTGNAGICTILNGRMTCNMPAQGGNLSSCTQDSNCQSQCCIGAAFNTGRCLAQNNCIVNGSRVSGSAAASTQQSANQLINQAVNGASTGSSGTPGGNQSPILQTITFPNPLQASSISGFLTGVLGALQGIVAVLAIIFVVIGGIMYITSGGSEALITKAKNTITYALVGLAIVIAAPSFLREVMTITGYTGTAPAGLSLRDIAMRTLAFLLSVVGIVGIISLVIGGSMYLTAYGDEKRIDTAKSVIKYSLIGIVIVMAALILVRQVASILGVIT